MRVRAYRRREAPSPDAVSAFHSTAPRDGETAQRVLNRVRADAATSPGGILAMFAIALTVASDSLPDRWKTTFGTVMVAVAVAVAVAVFGVWLYIWQSARHRCANMWKGALEAS
jgi:protein-S-isoprenylcysteine O-methyltransferase Ste14